MSLAEKYIQYVKVTEQKKHVVDQFMAGNWRRPSIDDGDIVHIMQLSATLAKSGPDAAHYAEVRNRLAFHREYRHIFV